MTPEYLAKSGSEHGEQSALFCWTHLPETRKLYPDLGTSLFFAIPNGGSRGDSAKSRMIRGSSLKAEGVKEGVPDTFLSIAKGGYFGLYIEMKRKGQKPSLEQEQFAESVTNKGYAWVYCDSWEKARDMLIAYMVMPDTARGLTNSSDKVKM